MSDEKYREAAEKTTRFLINQIIPQNRLSLIDCKGWLRRGDQRNVQFDQQPIDAFWMVELGIFAYRYTKDTKYLNLMRAAFDWFLGVNDAETSLYDRITGGCFDGLNPEGANINQGAESTLSAVLALLSIIEMAHQQSVGVNDRGDVNGKASWKRHYSSV